MRNQGFDINKYYTERDFKDGCWFNYIFGFGSGVGVTVLSALIFIWLKGWIL